MADTQESKPDGEEHDEMVTIRAHHKKTGEVTIMRVKKGTPMGEVFKQYADKKGLTQKSLSFVADGKAIPDHAKPMDLKKSPTVPIRDADEDGPNVPISNIPATDPSEPIPDDEDCGCVCWGYTS
mmetsp:Transcript_18778/g.24380  ORF Transcript_18778/g.24380 Transcript_18778/m.24380 type:complete len:125 (+) Transcript_18778:74-448(+)|eukprot:CAMPEP_0197326266 /NCGR_PEP_ID=MMETSP0892-20130614/1522_1 /TAXON_ID=44058 ORGANISM="Aureoumbra lagunensis, Strain CCMP1510" /NCGR_SAMPLE_ID=MMETSP0892 /ASSEMBLY_ACC=CAM_ASM_000538 /LENGTH=124 /DNA_ID=CAMNT_0042820231 /DNA_START=74 /DNA_END=448 /DNA_ORIENTATION=-